MEIKPIRNGADYERALRRIEELWDSAEGSAESDELDIVTTLVEAYEREHYPVDPPTPVDAIKFRLEQGGQDKRSLVGVIGHRTRVYEVMGGKRPLSLKMIRRLHETLNIPAEVLLQPPKRRRELPARPSGEDARRTAIRKSA